MAKASGAFRRLADNLAELAQVPSRVAAPVAADINEELARQFAQGSDPYGQPWQKLRPSTIRKKGHDLIMIDTGETERETRAVPMQGAGIELVSTEQAQHHQTPGDHGRPARPVLPNKADLPISWQKSIEKRTEEAFRKVLK